MREFGLGGRNTLKTWKARNAKAQNTSGFHEFFPLLANVRALPRETTMNAKLDTALAQTAQTAQTTQTAQNARTSASTPYNSISVGSATAHDEEAIDTDTNFDRAILEEQIGRAHV